MRQIIKLLIFFQFVFNFAEAKMPPPGTGTSNVPANILIMLDNSGSMTWDIDGNYISSWTKMVNNPWASAVDSRGWVYVYELYNRRIMVFDDGGNRKFNKGSYGYGCNQFLYVNRMQIHNDIIYLLDSQTGTVKKLNQSLNCLGGGNITVGPQFTFGGLAVSDDYVYLGGTFQSWQNYIRIYDRNNLGSLRATLTDGWDGYQYMESLSVNSDGTKLALVSYRNHKVCVRSISGLNLGSCQKVGNSSYGSGTGYFNHPTSVVFDSNDNIYVLDQSHRIQKFDSSRSFVKQYYAFSYSDPFRNPVDISISSSDRIYAVDQANSHVYEFNTDLGYIGKIGIPKSRMQMAKAVIKQIVSNSDLITGANFGLMQWGNGFSPYLKLRIPVSSNGASLIYTDIDNVRGGGGTQLLEAMQYARQYWTNGVTVNGVKYNSPRLNGAACQLNFNILISDGEWWNHTKAMRVVADMKNRLGVKTFSVGLKITGSNKFYYNELARIGDTKPALYADSQAQLFTALADAIKQAISGTLTFTTPAVMSELQRGDFIYQSTFKYEKHKQWQGRLKKYKLNSDGSFGPLQWDAGDLLNNVKPDKRNIWTINAGTTGINNLIKSNKANLKAKLFPLKASPTDAETDELIDFVRGFDSYDTDSDTFTNDERHKLADIYNSELVVVGRPEASVTDTGFSNFQKTDAYYRLVNGYEQFKSNRDCGVVCNNREELIYAGANSGILHAFTTSQGKEKWGYIPPNLIGKISNIVTLKANATNPIYGVDGSPVVKDIFYDDTPNDNSINPRWRTVLISGLGSGGQGYFAIDVTDPDNPRHLFAFENDSFNKSVHHWGEDKSRSTLSYGRGTLLPRAELDYTQIGESWSTPRIIRIKVKDNIKGVHDKWVAVFGAGYNGAVQPDYGSAVYIIDIENEGKVLKKIKIDNQLNSRHNYFFGLPAGAQEVNLGTKGLNRYNKSSEKIIVDGVGNMGYSISEDINGNSATNIRLKFDQILPQAVTFIVSKVPKNQIVNSVPSDLTVITADSTDKADFHGALVYVGDLQGKITKIDLTETFEIENNVIKKNINTTTLFTAESNSTNDRYIFHNLEATINDDNNLWLYFGTGNMQKLAERNGQIRNRLFGIIDKDFPNYQTISPVGTVRKCTSRGCPGGAYPLGWFVNLPNSQKVTAQATVDRDRVYFSIYEPTNAADCEQGKGILGQYELKCGAGGFSISTELGSGVLSKVVAQGDKLYVGISGQAKSGLKTQDNLIQLNNIGISQNKEIQLEGWRENY